VLGELEEHLPLDILKSCFFTSFSGLLTEQKLLRLLRDVPLDLLGPAGEGVLLPCLLYTLYRNLKLIPK